MKINYKRILVNVLLTLIGLEIVLRVFGISATFNERIGHGYASYYNQKLPTWYHTWQANTPVVYNEPEIKYSYPGNSLGLREREIPMAKTDSIKRLFILGDSFVEGNGVTYENSMPSWLQKKLDSAGVAVDVFNAGVSGSDPFYEYTLLRDKLMPLRPDLVIVCINQTDIQDYIFRGGMDRFKADGTTVNRKGPWWEPAYHYSYVFRVFMHRIRQYDKTLTKKTEAATIGRHAETEIQQCLYTMQRLCNANHVKLVCAVQPIHSSVKEPDTVEDIETLATTVSPDSIQLIDLYPDFKKSLNNQNWPNYGLKINDHFNPRGYRLFADVLFDDINKQYPGFWR